MGFTLCPALTPFWSSQTGGRRTPASPSDRDRASLHKVAGRNWAGAQHHRTCQQSHWATGTNSSLHRLPSSFFQASRSSSHSFIHSSPPHLATPFPQPLPPVSSHSLLAPALPLPLPVFLFREREQNFFPNPHQLQPSGSRCKARTPSSACRSLVLVETIILFLVLPLLLHTLEGGSVRTVALHVQ